MHSASKSLPASASSAVRVAAWQGQWLGACGLLVLIGFSWLPDSYTRMVSWPSALIWQSAVSLWVGWSLWMSRQFSLPLRKLGYGLDWIVLLSVVSCGLSTLAAEFRAIAYSNFLLFLSYIVILYTATHWIRQSPKLLYRLWFTIAAAGTLTHLISLVLWQPTANMWASGDFYSAIRNPHPLGHHNFVGGYCLLMLPLVVGFAFTQQRWRRLVGYGAIFINLIALYASGSRGALLGGAALGFVALSIYGIYARPKQIRHWLLIGLSLLILIGAIVSNPRVRSLVSIAPSSASTAFSSAVSLEQINDGPTKDRLFMLHAAQRIVQKTPLIGIGPGNLSRLYNRYRPIEAGGGLEIVQQLHNTPAQILAELGAVGFCTYAALIGWLVHTGIQIHRALSHAHQSELLISNTYSKSCISDRILLYSIGASWFAYLISSLTDYQLENIGISTTLLFSLALLVVLADTHISQPLPTALSYKERKIVSIGLILFLSLLLPSWIRTDSALYFGHAAQQNAEKFNYAAADAQWMKASQLTPWDPTFAILAAEQLIEVKQTAAGKANETELQKAAIASLQAAIQAAPNDPWIHQNLAVLLLPSEPQQAQVHLHSTIRLFPRSSHHTYYTLGRSYLKQRKPAEAITAFSLESLIDPQFLTSPLWQTDPFLPLLDSVVDKTIAIQQRILSDTKPHSRQYSWLQRQMTLTQWWHQKPFTMPQSASPIEEALLTIEEDPQLAVRLLQQIADTVPGKAAAKASLLLAWLSPGAELSPLLHSFKITSEEKRILDNNIQTYRNLRKWLSSIAQPASKRLRFDLSFAYRNAAADHIRKILFADNLRYPTLLNYLSLFPDPPREFAQLDRAVVAIAQQELGINFDR